MDSYQRHGGRGGAAKGGTTISCEQGAQEAACAGSAALAPACSPKKAVASPTNANVYSAVEVMVFILEC